MRCVKSSKNRLGFTRLLFEGLQVWWIVDYRETWRVTGEYDLSDVNQKSKSFNWTLRFERDTLPCLLLEILVWKVGSRYEKPWKRKKRKRGDIFSVLGTIIISECISLDNNKRPIHQCHIFLHRAEISLLSSVGTL